MKLKVTFYSDRYKSKQEIALIDIDYIESDNTKQLLKMIACLSGRDDIDRQVTKLVSYLTGRCQTHPSYTFSGSNNFIRVERVYERTSPP